MHADNDRIPDHGQTLRKYHPLKQPNRMHDFDNTGPEKKNYDFIHQHQELLSKF